MRARAGNHGGDFAGDRGRFPLRGRATREEGDDPGAWGRAGSGKTRALAERASSADRWARGVGGSGHERVGEAGRWAAASEVLGRGFGPCAGSEGRRAGPSGSGPGEGTAGVGRCGERAGPMREKDGLGCWGSRAGFG